MTTFGDRLNQLFAQVYPAGRGPHTLQEVADAINAEGSTSISPSYLSQLRSGQKSNPSARTVESLARFFRVQPDFFFDTDYARHMEHDLEMLTKMRDSGVRAIAARAFDLSVQGQETVRSMVELVRRSEGLPSDRAELPKDSEDHASND